MNYKKLAIATSLLCALLLSSYALLKHLRPTVAIATSFSTTTPSRQTIRHRIHANGILKIKDSIRVGSLVAGLVKEILVQENDRVEKNQLLAIIDNGKSDTAIRSAEGGLLQAESVFEYAQALREREEDLFAQGLRSLQEIQAIRQQFKSSKGALMIAQAHLDAARIEHTNTHIKAPEDGIIVAVGVKKGLRITTDLDATVLFEIAKDTAKMEAEFSLEESAAGHVSRGQVVEFTVDNHPHKKFKTSIKSVSYAPFKTSSGLIYRATADIDNSSQLLRPGMTLHATIKVAKRKHTLAAENIAFYLDSEAIEAAAKALGYSVRAIPAAEKKELEEQHRTIKYVWVHEGNAFIEKAIETGLYDDRYIETLSGLDPEQRYLTDIFQPGEMDDYYKKMFKGAL